MRTLMVAAAAALVAVVIASRQDITRFIRIKQISAGHPEYVPAEGHQAYPH